MKTKVHFLQTYIVLLSGVAAMLFSASCSESDSPSADLIADTQAGETSRVEILIPRNITTRTYISEDDNESSAAVEWAKGDELALWTKVTNEGGSPQGPTKFTYLAPSADEQNEWALFYCKEMEIPVLQGQYTYYAVSPAPTSSSGTTAYFTVPAEQDGKYDSSVRDILWAQPVEAKRLMANLRNQINFTFKHILHALKITVPSVPLDGGISKVRIEFPCAVAGRLGIDLTNGSTSLTEGANAITVTFDTPKMSGDTFWVFVAPNTAVSGEVHFIATDSTDYTFPKTSSDFKKFESGRITPVSLTNLSKREQKDFTVKITENHLGEPITNIASLTLPEGYSTPGMTTGSNIVPLTKKGSDFTIRMFVDVVDELAQNRKPLSAPIESANTEGLTATGTVTASGSDKIFALTAPYLFSEDFSNVKSADRYNDTDNDLASYNLPGWSGKRYRLEANLAAGINLHLATVNQIGNSLYHGRMDTPFMTHLKAGANVTLSVSYDIGGSMCTGNLGGRTTAYITYDFGMVTSTEASNDAIETVAFTEEPGTEGSYTNLPYHKTVTVNNCTQKHRLSWRTNARTDVHGASTITGVNIYLYLDNIKVSIVP